MKTRLAARNEELPAGVDEARAFRLAMKIAPCGAKMKNELCALRNLTMRSMISPRASRISESTNVDGRRLAPSAGAIAPELGVMHKNYLSPEA